MLLIVVSSSMFIITQDGKSGKTSRSLTARRAQSPSMAQTNSRPASALGSPRPVSATFTPSAGNRRSLTMPVMGQTGRDATSSPLPLSPTEENGWAEHRLHEVRVPLPPVMSEDVDSSAMENNPPQDDTLQENGNMVMVEAED